MTKSTPPHSFSPYLHLFTYLGDDTCNAPKSSPAYLTSRNDGSQIIMAAQANKVAPLKALLSTDNHESIDVAGLAGETALHMAAALGYIDVAKALLAAGAAPNTRDKECQTPLTHCARFCPSNVACDMASLLLASGADPAHRVSNEDTPATALYFAVQEHKPKLVQLLEPLTPRHLDLYPAESDRNVVTVMAIISADRHGDTSVLEWLFNRRQLENPRRKVFDLGLARSNATFSALVKLHAMTSEDARNAGPRILKILWLTHRRRLVECLKQLVEQYGMDVNSAEMKEFVLETQLLPELVSAAQEYGAEYGTLGVNVVV